MSKKLFWLNPMLSLSLLLTIGLGGANTLAFVLATPSAPPRTETNRRRGLNFQPFLGKVASLMKGAAAVTEPKDTVAPTLDSMAATCFSLADQYLVEASFDKESSTTSCRLYLLSRLKQKTDKAYQHSEGAMSFDCVTRGRVISEGAFVENEITITEPEPCKLQVQVSQPKKSTELVAVLCRIMVQFAISNLVKLDSLNSDGNQQEWTIAYDNEESATFDNSWSDNEMKALYDGIFDIVAGSTELVEMVDSNGQALGQVPRKLVHQFNLLHRGIGLFVTKDVPIQLEGSTQPDLYVHQRTSTKRIFPSLYDMFVGGISLAKEPAKLTAQREVAEELGLKKGSTQLSDKLWTCIVCTAYNRCVVDFFSYTMLTDKETVAWQEEEVAWGSFVPYSVVEASADLSIQRLAKRNEWPGRYPPVQAGNGNQQHIAWPYSDNDGGSVSESSTTESWKDWDYVPDGLLVWESWLDKISQGLE